MIRERDEQEPGTHTPLDFEAMAAAGDIDIIRPSTPEAVAFAVELAGQLDGSNAELIARDGPDAMTSVRLLRQAGLLAEGDPGTVAGALASYRERLGFDHAGLAAWLGVNATQLAALGLCARPDPASPAFIDIVGELTRRYGADAGRLAEALG